MTIEILVLLIAIFSGAALQVGVGIGFSIIVAPVAMVLMGTATAVPVLLLLNTVVSAVGIDRRIWGASRELIKRAIVGCLVGILVGLLVYPFLSERAVLMITAILLLFGVISTLMPVRAHVSPGGYTAISGLSGLATVWAATPGPLMMFGFLAIGRPAQEARRLVQPVALVAYGVAFGLHGITDLPEIIFSNQMLVFIAITVAGSLLGRVIGPRLPQRALNNSIRVVAIIACAVLFQRAIASP